MALIGFTARRGDPVSADAREPKAIQCFGTRGMSLLGNVM